MGLDDVGGPSVSDSAAPGPEASWEKGGETHSETREGYAHVWGQLLRRLGVVLPR